MVTRRIVLSLLAFAPVLVLGAGPAQAFNPQPEPPAKEVTFQDGTRAIVDDNRHVFTFQPAKDGTYKTKDGQTLSVVKGAVAKGAPGAAR